MMTILVAALVVCVSAVVLAILLLAAERFLINYGPCRIDINSGRKSLTVEGGQSLLGSLKNEGIFIPSACGGRGTCAYCKVKVLSGGGPVAPTEEPLLTGEEIASNVRISCQVKIRNDIAIEIPSDMFDIRQYKGAVENIRDLTYDTKELRIRLMSPDSIKFEPGQYVQLEAPAYGRNPEPIYRAYSISSPPSDSHYIEMIIRRVPDGICTTWVFDVLRDGDTVMLNGPYGEFKMTDSDRSMVWIAGGSGMAPFWSMIRHMKETGSKRKCTYFFGAVARRDLFLVDELQAISAEMPNFTFIPALSGENVPDDWTGQRGLITDVVARSLENPPDVEAYLCGSAGMIDAAVKMLTANGVSTDRIFYDKFN
ncbi:MAG: 2Fe-2S iron-sulfur cluster binding domain-containing protein [Planctomycetes bacterium]|jgi:Na+-transporting NADH:ubiquinone oxidoreductase subunit F|nr:2Fe-2S iron-sulfur cluster binding domain-containing protein [Planctomycetota bacterium]